ncbi:MAG: ATP-binding protein [Longimicrobiales bacterium]
MRRSAWGLLALAPLLSPGPVAAQIADLRDAWRWSEFYVQSGLPSNSVTAIVEAPDGTVWVSTAGGPAWFDGYAWHPVSPADGLPTGRVLALDRGRSGSEMLAVVDRRLFVGSGSSGFRSVPVVLESGDTVEVGDAVAYGEDILVATSVGLVRIGEPSAPLQGVAGQGIESRITERVSRTRSGTIWFNSAAGLQRLQDDVWTMVIPHTAEPLQVSLVLEEPEGPGWTYVGWPVPLKGIWRWTPEDGATRIPDPGLAGMRALALDAEGRPLALSERNRLYTISDGGWQEIQSLPVSLGEITSLRRASDGATWVGSDGGLYLHRESDQYWTAIAPPDVGAWNRVNAILPLEDGSVWMGTNQGLVRAGADGVVDTLPAPDGRPFAEVTGVARDGDGRLWVTSGARSEILRIDPDGSMQRLDARTGLDHAQIHRVSIDAGGQPWFLALDGVRPDGSPSPGGVFQYSDGRFARWPPAAELPSTRVYDMAEGPLGELYFGTGAGVAGYFEGAWQIWNRPTPLRASQAFAVDVAPDGTIWFADRYRGVGRVEGDSISYYTGSDVLPNDEVWDVLVDADSTVWASTQGGLARYVHGQWITLGSDVGVPRSPLWPLAFADGRLYVGTMSLGAVVIDLAAAQANAPVIMVDEPTVRGKFVDLSWTAYAYMGQTTPARMATRYRIDQGPWSPWRTRRGIQVELAAGGHDIEVEAQGPLGKPVTRAGLAFRVQPPLLLRPLVLFPIVGLSLLVAALAAILHRRRERHRTELEENEERYRRFFEEDLTGDCIFDRAGIIRACNPAFARMFGFESARGAVGQPLASLTEDPDWFDHVMAEVAGGGRVEYAQDRFCRRDGTPIHAVYNIVLNPDPEGPTQGRAYFFDDTPRMNLEEQLRQSQKMEAVGQLAGGVAHDFNNLLTAVSGYAELLLEDLPAGSPHRADVGGIVDAARRAKELTSKLLAFGRRQVLELRAVQVPELVEGMKPLLRRIGGANLSLDTEYSAALPRVEADSSSLEQVILNLVVNASDAMGGDGRVLLRASTRNLSEEDAAHLEGSRPGHYVVLEVEDDGPGIPPEILDRIFEPFFTTKETGRGTGLGLAMVYGIVRQSGGFVLVDSSPGSGTRFSVFLLPARARDHRGDVEAEREATLAARPYPATSTILLVEDEEAVRHLLERALRRQGFTVVTATGAQDALRAVATGADPDVIVSDVSMPGQSGTELLAELRRRGVDAPVLLVSGHASDDLPAAEVHNADFLQKPFTPSDLASVLREILQREPV